MAGGCAGAIARTATAPLDRIKLLFQVQAVALPPSTAASEQAYTGVLQAARKILHEEGILAFWKGNGTNILRIFPYSAAQMSSNDQYKRLASDTVCHWKRTLHMLQQPHPGRSSRPTGTTRVRRLCGHDCHCTHPPTRHPAPPPSPPEQRLPRYVTNDSRCTHAKYMPLMHTHFSSISMLYTTGMTHALRAIVAAEGPWALFRGLAPALVSVAPYAALNFSAYDLLKSWLYGGGRCVGIWEQSTPHRHTSPTPLLSCSGGDVNSDLKHDA